TPVAVAGVSTATSLASGSDHSCAALTDGTLRCWGYNYYGQLGNGTSVNSSTPVAVSGISTATAIDAGDNHSCARLSNGSMRCWGLNSDGQLGMGTVGGVSMVPATVSGISAAVG